MTTPFLFLADFLLAEVAFGTAGSCFSSSVSGQLILHRFLVEFREVSVDGLLLAAPVRCVFRACTSVRPSVLLQVVGSSRRSA